MQLSMLLSSLLLATSTVLAAGCPYTSLSKRSVSDHPKSYVNKMTSADWEDIKKQLTKLWSHIAEPIEVALPPNNPLYNSGFSVGPTTVRLSWHQAGTFDLSSQTGGPHGDVDESASENAGLKRAIDALNPIWEQYNTSISKADLWSFAASVYITNNNPAGLEIKWRPGRADRPVIAGNATLAARLPGPEMSADDIRTIFQRMGFTEDKDIVTLLGTHSIGFASAVNTGYNGAWGVNALTLTNDFFVRLVSMTAGEDNKAGYSFANTSVDPFGVPVKRQWLSPSDLSMMLPSDVMLVNDTRFAPWTRLFAQDQDAFFRSYEVTFQKLQELGFAHHELGQFVDTKYQNTITYKIGAPVKTKPVNLYYVFYGTWSDAEKAEITAVGNGIDQTAWYKNIKTYYSQASARARKVFVDGSVKVAKTVSDNYSFGKQLGVGNVSSILASNIGAGKPLGEADENGVYAFMFSADVWESSQFGSYCIQWCSYKSSFTVDGKELTYGSMSGGNLVPTTNPPVFGQGFCPVCAPPLTGNANGPANYLADETSNLLAQVLVKAVTNPSDSVASWSDSTGHQGPVDICFGSFGRFDEISYNQAAFFEDSVAGPNGTTINLQLSNFWNVKSSSCVV